MKALIIVLVCLVSTPRRSAAQDILTPLGLQGKAATSISVNSGIIAVGTDRHGVYWQSQFEPTPTGWAVAAGLEAESVQSVYAHKSGPIGWAISAGVRPTNTGDPFLYCSYLGESFESRSDGIDQSVTTVIEDIDGFPDPTVCGETFAAGGRTLYRRDFADTTWKPVYETTHDGFLTTVKVRQEHPGVVLTGGGAGFSGFLLVKSTDLGETWENISPPATVISVDFAGGEAERIFVAALTSIFRSEDEGQSWESVWDGTGSFLLSEIWYDPATRQVAAAGRTDPDTAGVLIVSHDDGANWREVILPVGPVVDLAVGGDYAFIVTPDDGIFRLSTASLSVEDPLPPGSVATLYPNYPNPFSQSTTIAFSLSEPSKVTVTVYDVLGREVATILSAVKPAGRSEVAFDARTLAPGLYVCRLEASGAVHTQRLVVTR